MKKDFVMHKRLSCEEPILKMVVGLINTKIGGTEVRFLKCLFVKLKILDPWLVSSVTIEKMRVEKCDSGS